MIGLETLLKQQDISVPLTTAQGVGSVPFQRWFKFKEAFSPQFVHDVVKKSAITINKILDPFGGSGTTALVAQMMGVQATTIEVNPFLSDLIESKLSSYDVNELISDWGHVQKNVNLQQPCIETLFTGAPATLYNNGETPRWIFDYNIIYRVAQYRAVIESLSNKNSEKLFRVLLGTILISFSNVLINGKGRRYRKNWQELKYSPRHFDEIMFSKVESALFDIVKYSKLKNDFFNVLKGDSRAIISEFNEKQDLILFSPPYPNTFDYTDIYNVELWVLGYLRNVNDNKLLRKDTLRSHVQVKVENSNPPVSETLNLTMQLLNSKIDLLWNKNIPAMVVNYFYDINTILENSMRLLEEKGMAVIVIGDSKYADIKIDTAKIVCELALQLGFTIRECQEIRIMKSSAQQGWSKSLSETAIYLGKDN